MTFSENKQIKLSIVIAAWNGISLLRECLSSLENQIEDAFVEVIIVSNFTSGISESQKEFPFAAYFILSAETTVPELRSYGIVQARGAIVALLEDLCTVDPGWCREIRKAHDLPYDVIGGAVENSSHQTALDWAVYFYDYGKYMPPNQAGITTTVSGANVSYKKEILEQLHENYKDGFFETFVHEELKRRGHNLYLTPSAVVYHNKNYKLKSICAQFYHQARSFAALRALNFSSLRRLLLIMASLLLPILLPVRVTARIVNKRKRFKELITSLPFLTILMSVWAFGEFCGYLTGEGKSRGNWK